MKTSAGDQLPNDSLDKYKKTPNNGFEIDENYQAPSASRNNNNNNNKFNRNNGKCHRCQRKGHIAKHCRMSFEKIERERKEREAKNSNDKEEKQINMVKVTLTNGKKVKVDHRMQFDATILGIKCKPIIDTGADFTIGGIKLYRELQKIDLTLKLEDKGKFRISGPGGESLNFLGKITVPLTMGGIARDLPMLIVER